MKNTWTFHILTFGCKVNQYETQALREAWTVRNGRETDVPAQADVVVLNTCAVTANAVREVRQTMRRLQRECPDAELVITGCAVEAAETEPIAWPGTALVVPQRDKPLLLGYAPKRCRSFVPAHEVASLPPETFPPFAISAFRRSRPVLKVQDGCSHRCAYCIVPLTRGPSRSRSPSAALAEIRRLLREGFREIMISGINLRQYAFPEEGVRDFWDLLTCFERELAPDWQGEARLRISSLEPGQLHERGLEVLASSVMICPHLHVSLQSGSPEVLRQMRRGHYGPEHLHAAVERIRTFWPRFGLGADILTGFPGETPAEAQETLELVKALPFSYAHVFSFSPRPGTPAASRSDQVPVAERRRRAERVRTVVADKRQAFLQSMLEEKMFRVSLESGRSGRGVNEYYVPCRLASPVSDIVSHALIPVRPLAVESGELRVVPA